MSRKLGATALVLAVLFCSMELKSVLTGSQHNGSEMVANGPDPMPAPPPKKSGKYRDGAVLVANGPDPMPAPPPKKSGK